MAGSSPLSHSSLFSGGPLKKDFFAASLINVKLYLHYKQIKMNKTLIKCNISILYFKICYSMSKNMFDQEKDEATRSFFKCRLNCPNKKVLNNIKGCLFNEFLVIKEFL